MGENNHNDDRFTITARDLLQTNATIIAGTLIFLTLALSFASTFGRPLDTPIIIYIALGTIPFVFSCDFLLTRWNNPAFGFRLARIATGFGMGYLATTILTFLFLSQYVPDTTTGTNTTNTNTTTTTTVPSTTNTTNTNESSSTVKKVNSKIR